MVNGQILPKMQCSMTIATFSNFGAKTKIALTGVGSITANLILLTLYFLLKLTHFLVKSAVDNL